MMISFQMIKQKTFREIKMANYVWAKASTETKPAQAYGKDQLVETDTGDVYEWHGDKNSGSWVKITDGGSAVSEPEGYDDVTGVQVIIPHEHHEVHEGKSFFVSVYDVDLDTSDTLALSLLTPALTKIHVLVLIDNTSTSLFEIIEGATNVDGSNIPVYNRDRNSATTSEIMSSKLTPTPNVVTTGSTFTGGTTIHSQVIRELGGGKEKIGGATRGSAEIILKVNTIYAFRLTGLADNGSANVGISWYEK